MFGRIKTLFTFAKYLIENEHIIIITMKRSTSISISINTINSRNGNGIFCSDFTGRNIVDGGYGFPVKE
jgi:hypothetical protein